MNKYTGGDAFPHQCANGDLNIDVERGMSLRDYFAAAVVQGLIYLDGYYSASEDRTEEAARHAYKFADAMLKARNA